MLIRTCDELGVEPKAVEALRDDGMMNMATDVTIVTPRGRLLVRTLAMVFNRFPREQQKRAGYSCVI